MNLDEFSIHTFNESNDSYFYILIREKNVKSIYSDLEFRNITYRSSDLNYQLTKVKKIKVIDNNTYFLLEKNNKILGYFSPENSITLFPKQRQQAKVISEGYKDNDLNKSLNINLEENEIIKDGKIIYSSFYCFYKGEVYEGLIFKDKLLGFALSSEIAHLYKKEVEFQILQPSNTYLDANLNKIYKSIKDTSKIFKTKYLLPKENKVRFYFAGKNAWISESDIKLSYSIESHFPHSIDECLLSSIIYTLNDKIDNYHLYYLRTLKKNWGFSVG